MTAVQSRGQHGKIIANDKSGKQISHITLCIL